MVGTFPLNVQPGSPQYTLITQVTITPDVLNNPTTITIDTYNTRPIDNAYYTIQNEDGSKWFTFYVDSWSPEAGGGYSTQGIITSASTIDVFPEGSICWCIWCYEYYESLVTPISTVNDEIDTLTPKVNNSFVSATKIGDSTLRLTRNNGTSVDISFPKGVDVRYVDISDMSSTYYQPKTITASSNELVIISGSNTPSSKTTRYTFSLSGYGYLKVTGKLFTEDDYSHTFGPGDTGGFTNGSPTDPLTFSGLLYNGGKLSYQRK